MYYRNMTERNKKLKMQIFGHTAQQQTLKIFKAENYKHLETTLRMLQRIY